MSFLTFMEPYDSTKTQTDEKRAMENNEVPLWKLKQLLKEKYY